MKTTVDIPDALACEAMDVAARDGATLCDLVLEGLRREIDRRAAVQAGFRARPKPGEGDPNPDLQDALPSSYRWPE
ncbi:MAG TPA: hypothetical protein VK045_15355 [Ornithinicoccus sp.]|nr:hypothetical protein [Ornithinicoccus sp.]